MTRRGALRTLQSLVELLPHEGDRRTAREALDALSQHEEDSARDRFAMAALPQFRAGGWHPEEIAKHAYAVADAMLAAREPKSQPTVCGDLCTMDDGITLTCTRKPNHPGEPHHWQPAGAPAPTRFWMNTP